MKRRTLIIAILAVGGLLMVGAVLFIVLSDQQLTVPQLPELDEITPPASLMDIAEEYPELASVLNDAELDGVYKEFLIAYQDGGPEAAEALAKERGLLTPDGESVRVTLVLDTEDNEPLVKQLASIGITVVSAYRDRINIGVPVALIEMQMESDEPAAIFAQLTELSHVIAVRLPEVRKPSSSDIEGEGIALIGADAWHDAGFTGEGLRIGVLDLGFYGYEELLGRELPASAPIEYFGWYDTEEVHGAACAEIVHEVAPGAALFFAWYDGTDAGLGEAYEWLLSKNVNIITHSVGAVVGPRDGTGWGTDMVDEAAARGILWVNSAGNEAQQHYRGTFTDTDGDGYHEFDVGEEVLGIWNNGYIEVFLMWEDSWDAPTQDYRLILVDSNLDIIDSSTDLQNGSLGQQPADVLWLETGGETVYAVVEAFNATRAVTFDMFVHGSGIDLGYWTPDYSVTSPGDAYGALTVGAIDWWDGDIAYYSSRGPTTDGRLKPDISGPAGVSGATYGESAFDGTSASTPHVAGAAALIWSAHPEYTRQQVIDALLAQSSDMGPSGPDTEYGYGTLRLPPAPQAFVPPTPTTEPTQEPTQEATQEPPPTQETLPPPTATLPPDQPTPTLKPLPTNTPVAYVTPTPEPDDDNESLAGFTIAGLLVGGMGCSGGALLLIGAVLMVRGSKRGSSTPPQPSYYAPPAPPMSSPP
ncbi:MAG: S8 family serine peptidase, partial [Anaerolineae bacterium]|nr:S8 family serine peptidase [Anaerolineae bacterium]